MVTFTQNMGGMNGMPHPNFEELQRFCAEHWQCEGCPLLTENMNFSGATVTCVTGRQKGMGNQNGQN